MPAGRGFVSPLVEPSYRYVLTITNDLGFSTFGYADDIIVVQGKFGHTVREIMQEAMDVVVKWAVK